MYFTTRTFIKGAAERALKTAAQTLLALVTTGAAINAINWPDALAITATAMLASILTSFADPDRTDTAIPTGSTTS